MSRAQARHSSGINPANSQLEGLLLALYALLDAIKRKGLLTEQDIEQALPTAEANAFPDPQRLHS